MDVNAKNTVTMFYKSHTSSSLVLEIKVVTVVELAKWLSVPVPTPNYPDFFVEGIFNMAEAFGLIPWYLAPGVILPDGPSGWYEIDRHWKLDKVTAPVRIEKDRYGMGASINFIEPTFISALCYYVPIGEPYTEIPESVQDRVHIVDYFDYGGTSFIADKIAFWEVEVVAASRHDTYNTTMLDLTNGLMAWYGVDLEDLHPVHILTHYDRWTIDNFYESDSGINIGGAITNHPMDGRQYRYYSGGVVYQLLFDWFTGPDMDWYPPREPINEPGQGSPGTSLIPAVFIHSGRLGGGLLQELMAVAGVSGSIPPADDYEEAFIGSGPLDQIEIGLETVVFEASS